jgi:predicted esterase
MRAVPVWRVYLGTPLYGRRAPEGGAEELMRRGAEDAVTLLLHPIITGAVAELPAAVDDLRGRLGIDAALPLGIFGFSQGGVAALLALSRRVLPIRAAVTFGAVIDVPAAVETMAPMFGFEYEWTEERHALAAEISATDRARALAESGAAILLGVGAEDPLPVREPAERLAAAIRAEGGTAETRVLPNLGHGFVEEPGVEAVAQGPQARAVDELASGWFGRHLG